MLKGFIFLLTIFMIVIAVVMIIVFCFIFKGIRMFRKMKNGQFDSQFTFEGFNKGKQASSQYKNATWKDKNGETLIDTRDAAHAGRKIFSADDGEYVDFKESK